MKTFIVVILLLAGISYAWSTKSKEETQLLPEVTLIKMSSTSDVLPHLPPPLVEHLRQSGGIDPSFSHVVIGINTVERPFDPQIYQKTHRNHSIWPMDSILPHGTSFVVFIPNRERYSPDDFLVTRFIGPEEMPPVIQRQEFSFTISMFHLCWLGLPFVLIIYITVINPPKRRGSNRLLIPGEY